MVANQQGAFASAREWRPRRAACCRHSRIVGAPCLGSADDTYPLAMRQADEDLPSPAAQLNGEPDQDCEPVAHHQLPTLDLSICRAFL